MVRVVIPTRDSARWIGVFLRAYRANGIEPLYVLDTRTDDRTPHILSAMKADVLPFTPSADHAEAGMLEFGSRAARTEWVLRLDDDEFPSAALLRWIETTATRSVRDGFYISRRDLFRHAGRPHVNRRPSAYTSVGRPGLLGPHARLYRPARLTFHATLHASGIVEEELFGFAPAAAFFAHFSALMTSPAERLAKIRRYEAMVPGSTWRLTDEYLPEMFEAAHLAPSVEGVEEFLPLIAQLPRPPADADIALAPHEREHARRAVAAWSATVAGRLRSAASHSPGDTVELLRRLPPALWEPIGIAVSLAGQAWRHSAVKALGRTVKLMARRRRARRRGAAVATRDGSDGGPGENPGLRSLVPARPPPGLPAKGGDQYLASTGAPPKLNR